MRNNTSRSVIEAYIKRLNQQTGNSVANVGATAKNRLNTQASALASSMPSVDSLIPELTMNQAAQIVKQQFPQTTTKKKKSDDDDDDKIVPGTDGGGLGGNSKDNSGNRGKTRDSSKDKGKADKEEEKKTGVWDTVKNAAGYVANAFSNGKVSQAQGQQAAIKAAEMEADVTPTPQTEQKAKPSQPDWTTRMKQRVSEMKSSEKYAINNYLNLIEQHEQLKHTATPADMTELNAVEAERKKRQDILKQQYGDEFNDVVRYFQMGRNKRSAKRREAQIRKQVSASPVRATVANIASVPLNILGAVTGMADIAGQSAERILTGSDAPIDTNTGLQSISADVQTVREQTAENIGKATNNDVLPFLYQTGMSGVDSLAASALGSPLLGSALLGTGSAVNATRDALESGASNGEALAMGAVAGGLETFFEKFSLGNLEQLKTTGNVKNISTLVKNVLKSSLVNASEEAATELSNAVAEALILGDNSQVPEIWNDAYSSASLAGKTKEEATKEANIAVATNLAKNVGMSAAGGALMGGAFGLYGSGLNYFANRGASQQNQTNNNAPLNQTTPNNNAPLNQQNQTTSNSNAPASQQNQTQVSNNQINNPTSVPTSEPAYEAQGLLDHALPTQNIQQIDDILYEDIFTDVPTQAPVPTQSDAIPDIPAQTDLNQSIPTQSDVIPDIPADHPNTVGSMESQYDNTPLEEVKSQTNSIVSNLVANGMNQSDAEAMADNTHSLQTIAYQTQQARQLINETGADTLATQLQDAVSSGETLNDQDSAALYLMTGDAVQQMLSSDNDADAERVLQLTRAQAKNSSTLGTALGFLGNQTKMNGHTALVKGQQALDNMRDALNPKQRQEIDTKTQAIDNMVKQQQAQVDEEIDLGIEQYLFNEAQKLAQEAKQRRLAAQAEAREAMRSAKKAERAADKAVEKANKRVRDANKRKDNAYAMRGTPAEIIAKQVTRRVKKTPPNQTSDISKLTSELFRVAEETPLPDKPATQRTTPIELLKLAYENQQLMSDIWEEAKKRVRDAHWNLDFLLEPYAEWLNNNKNPLLSQRTMQAAVTQGVLERVGTIQQLTAQIGFNNYDAVVTEVANYLSKQIGADEATSKQIWEDVNDLLWTKIGKTKQDYANNLQKNIESNVNRELSVYNLRDLVKQYNGDMNAVKQAVADNLALQYGMTTDSASRIANQISSLYQSKLKAAIESNLKQLLPELYGKTTTSKASRTALDKFLDVVNMGTYTTNDIKDLIASKWGIPPMTADQAKRIAALGDKASKLNPDSKAYSDTMDDIAKIMAENVTGTAQEKNRAWRYLAMLMNPRTHIRNVSGNVGMGTEVAVKDIVGTALEHIAIRDKSERTKALLTPKDKNLLGSAYVYADNVWRQLTGGSSRFNAAQGIDAHKQIFKTKWLDSLAKRNSSAMQGADIYGTVGALNFISEGEGKLANAVRGLQDKAEQRAISGNVGVAGLKAQFARSLAQQIKAKGLDASILTSMDAKDVELVQQMAERAVRDAQQATFHEESQFANWLSNQVPDSAKPFVEGLLPFTKTPINVAKQAVRYSPLGMVTSTKTLIDHLNKGTASVADVVDGFAKATTGSGMMLGGVLLALSGLIHMPDPDDEKRRLDVAQGKQDYSLVIGDKTYTVDWAAPAATSLLVGAALVDVAKREGVNWASLLSVMAGTLDPLVETSMLSSLDDLIDSVRYGNGGSETIGGIAQTVAYSMLGQYFPTIGGQLARTIDNTRRSYTAIADNSVERNLRSFGNEVMNKTPFLSNLNEERVDLWGRTSTNGSDNPAIRAGQNFLSPGYLADINTTTADTIIEDLYQRGIDEKEKTSSVIPSVKASDANVKLTEQTYVDYAKTRGQTQYELIEALDDLPAWDGLPVKSQQDIVSDIYTIAKLAGDKAVDSTYTGGDNAEKLYDLYMEHGINDTIDYLATAKTYNAINNAIDKGDSSADVVSRYADALDELYDLDNDVADLLSDEVNKARGIYADAGEKGLEIFLTAKQATKNVEKQKDVAATLRTLDFTPQEAGYAYAMKSASNSKARQAYNKYNNPTLCYYILCAHADGYDGDAKAEQIRNWAKANVPSDYRNTVIKVLTKPAKEW